MKKYCYTCKSEAERVFLVKTATVFGHSVRNLDWRFLAAETFAGPDDGEFVLCGKDSAMAGECREVAGIGEMVKVLAGMTEIKEFVEPEPIWKIGCYEVTWWNGKTPKLKVINSSRDAVETTVDFPTVNEIYQRGKELWKR